MNREKVTKLLKDYRSYKYAVKNCESEPLGSGMKVRQHVNSNRLITVNEWDYERYSRMISMIDGAVKEVLSDEEQKVIEHKYLDRNTLTLYQIATRCYMTEDRAKYLHKTALNALSKALMFVDVPDIHNLDHVAQIDQAYA